MKTQRGVALRQTYAKMFKNSCALAKVPSGLYTLLAIFVVGNLSDETNRGKEIRKIETGIDQLKYRIIKLENGIDARKAPGKVQGYKSGASIPLEWWKPTPPTPPPPRWSTYTCIIPITSRCVGARKNDQSSEIIIEGGKTPKNQRKRCGKFEINPLKP